MRRKTPSPSLERTTWRWDRNWHREIYIGIEINSLAPGKFEWNFRHVIVKQILVIDERSISCEIALIWMSLDFSDDQSTLVQVMAWCRQATSHYLSQCWPRFMLPYGITRPQWVNILSEGWWGGKNMFSLIKHWGPFPYLIRNFIIYQSHKVSKLQDLCLDLSDCS